MPCASQASLRFASFCWYVEMWKGTGFYKSGLCLWELINKGQLELQLLGKRRVKRPPSTSNVITFLLPNLATQAASVRRMYCGRGSERHFYAADILTMYVQDWDAYKACIDAINDRTSIALPFQVSLARALTGSPCSPAHT